MAGELLAVACAFLWALSSTLIKSQTHKVNVVSLAAWRTVPAVLIYLGLLIFSGRMNDILHLSFRTLAFLLGSTLLGLVLGDLLYFRSLKLIGLARAMPLSATYPFFTLVLSLLFLDELVSWGMVVGAVLITGGAYLLAFPRGRSRTSSSTAQGTDREGVAMAVLAAVCWAVSTVTLGIGLVGLDVTVANFIRVGVLAIILFAMLLRRGEIGQIRAHGLRSLGVAFLAGIVGTGLGTYAFLTAVQRAGAAKTSILTSTTPLFGLPFSLVLGERLHARTLLGTILTVTGIWLIL